MKIQPGQIVKVNGTVVQILDRAAGVMQWRCDDGRVHRASKMMPATETEIQAHRAELARERSLIDAFETWERRETK